jgi:hypothetical protein
MLRANVKKMYLEQYPNLTLKEIEEEIASFDLTLFDKAGISVDSSNRHKYLRGWLMRANLLKEEKTKEESMDSSFQFFKKYHANIREILKERDNKQILSK